MRRFRRRAAAQHDAEEAFAKLSQALRRRDTARQLQAWANGERIKHLGRPAHADSETLAAVAVLIHDGRTVR